MSIHTFQARRSVLSLALILASAAPLTAQLPGIPAAPPVSFTVGPATVSIIAGQRSTFAVTGRTSTGGAFVPSSDAVITVNVADRSIVSAPATVTMLHGQSSASLALTALAIGRTTVTVGYAGLAASADVTVMGVDGSTVAALPPASVTLAPLVTTLQVGGHVLVAATVRTSTGTILTGRTLAWRSSAPAVATVSSTGAVTAVAAGTAVVTASDGTVSGTMSVTVPTSTSVSSPATPPPVAVGSVVIAPAGDLSVIAGMSVRLRATALDAAGQPLTGRVVSWTSSNAANVRVGTDGTVVGTLGSATITAACEGKSTTLAVTVAPRAIAHSTEAP